MWKYTFEIFSVFVLVVSLSLVSGPALSQGADAQAPEPTQIEADSEIGEVWFYVDGVLSSLPMRAAPALLYPDGKVPRNPEATAENTRDAPEQDDLEQRGRR